jgi:hypothetical protein
MRAPLKQANLWGNAMSELLALSVSVAVLGGIWAFIALGPLAGFALAWAGFIAVDAVTDVTRLLIFLRAN